MSRGIGRVQRLILEKLNERKNATDELSSLAIRVFHSDRFMVDETRDDNSEKGYHRIEIYDPDCNVRDRSYSPSEYSSIQRAVALLKKQGLVITERIYPLCPAHNEIKFFIRVSLSVETIPELEMKQHLA